MIVSLVDVIIVLLILMGAIVGFKNGAIKEGTKFIGLFIIIIVSFILKDSLMVLLYENLPFFNFFGIIKGIDAINILFYQLVSFLIIFAILMFVLKVLIVVTGIIEWLLKLTVFLSIPSKILGIFVGALEYYVYLFIALYILNMPVFGLTLVNDSKFGNIILDETPILSDLVDDTVDVYSDVWNVVRNRGDLSDKEVNSFVLATLLDNDLITIDSARKLVESNYIIIEDESILDKYDDDKSLFEEIGGCLVIGGCDGNNFVKEVTSVNVSNATEVASYDDVSFKVDFISINSCLQEGNCSDDEEIKVGLIVNTSYGKREMTISTRDSYVWIPDTLKYVFAKIDNGKLKVGIAKYSIGG